MATLMQWLLEENEPSIRYRTMVELLDVPEDSLEAFLARQQILKSGNIAWLAARLDCRGVVPHVPKYYGNFTTFRYLYALSELGLRKDDPYVNRLVDWIFYPTEEKREYFIQPEFQDEHAYLLDESNLGSCNQIDFLGTLLRLGYLQDARVQRLLHVFLEKCRFDGGYLCKWQKSRHEGQIPKSCYTASVNALRVFSYLPEEYRRTEAFRGLLEYFTSRNMLYSKTEPRKMLCSTVAMYNGCGYSHLFVIADAMSRMGLGNIPEMSEVWELLHAKKAREGRIFLEATDGKDTIHMPRVGTPNKYLTLKWRVCLKHKKERSV